MTRLRLALILVVAALVCAPAATAAPARLVPVSPGEGAGPVVTAGGATYWLEAAGDGIDRVMRVAPEGDQASVVAELPRRFSGLGNGALRQFSLAASDERWVVGRLAQKCVDRCSILARDALLAEQFAGTPDTPPVQIAGCGQAAGESTCTPADAACVSGILDARVDGPVLATQTSAATSCSAPAPVTISTLDGSSSTLPVTGALTDLAGPFVLVSGRVYDWTAPGAPAVSRVPGEEPLAAAIDAAGVVAYADRTQLLTAAPGAAAQVAARIPPAMGVVAFAGGRVLLSGTSPGAVAVSPADATTTPVRLAHDVKAWSFPPAPAFNGDRVAYLADHCAALTMVIQGLRDTIPGSCRLPAVSRTLKDPMLRLRCPRGAVGCAGRYRLLVTDGRRTIRRSGDFAVQAGDPGTIYDVLTEGELRRLSHARATLTLTPQTEPGATPTVRSRTLRLRIHP